MIRLALQGMHDRRRTLQAYEVLARMECPEKGVVGPADFGTLTAMKWPEIDIQVLASVLASKFITTAPTPIFINVSPETISNVHAFGLSCSLLNQIALKAKSKIVVEIPERSDLCGSALDGVLAAIKAAGCMVAIDDFGSHYADFDRLSNHDWDFCKVCLESVVDTADLNWLISLKSKCDEKGTKVVFEKLESIKDLDIFRVFPNPLLQGYAFSRPAMLVSFEPVIGKVAYA